MNKSAACSWFNITRQAYYQARKRELVREAEEQLIVELTQGIRQRHPRMGTRKIYDKLRAPMATLGIRRGRMLFSIFCALTIFW